MFSTLLPPPSTILGESHSSLEENPTLFVDVHGFLFVDWTELSGKTQPKEANINHRSWNRKRLKHHKGASLRIQKNFESSKSRLATLLRMCQVFFYPMHSVNMSIPSVIGIEFCSGLLRILISHCQSTVLNVFQATIHPNHSGSRYLVTDNPFDVQEKHPINLTKQTAHQHRGL